MIHERILSSSRVGIFTHINPDGDALGSSFGLAGYLEDIGKNHLVFLPCKWGESLDFMIPGSILPKIRIWNPCAKEALEADVASCDLLIGLDFNTPERIGGFCELFRKADSCKILIDHHLNPSVGDFDEIHSDTQVSSASELLYRILKQMPETGGDAGAMSSVTREAVLTGITTDTNNFANSVFPSTLSSVGELMAAGTDRDAIIQQLYFRYPERRIRAQGAILDRLMEITDEGVGYIVLDRKFQEEFGLKEGDTEGFVNIPLSIRGVRMSILAKEDPDDNKRVRISIRSKRGTSAQQCAARYFHGGGHELASGGKLIKGEDIASMDEVPSYITNSTKDFFLSNISGHLE